MLGEWSDARICSTFAGWLRDDPPSDPGWSPEVWRRARHAARVHGVGPVLARRLAGAGWLDPEVRRWLATSLDLNERRVGRLHDEAEAVLGLAERRGVEVVPLKGLTLTGRYLAEPGLRPMADLDLLVRPGDREAIAGVLRELGYEQRWEHFKHRVFSRGDGAVASREFEHPDNPRPVEVHTTCAEDFAGTPVDLTDAVWQASPPGELLGVRTRVPRADVLWAHLVVHAAWQLLYGGGRLIQLLDLAWLAPRVADRDAAVRLVDPRAALLALELVDRHLPGVVEPAILARLNGDAPPPLRRLVAAMDLANSSYLAPTRPCRARRILRFHAGRRAPLRRALRYILLPRVSEMHINHERVGRGPSRLLAYPVLWAWHLANLTVRSGGP